MQENKRCLYMSKQLFDALVKRARLHKETDLRRLMWRFVHRDEAETLCDKCGKEIEKDPIILCEDCYKG